MSLEFTLVRRAISLAVIDGPDSGDNPDVLQAQGSVLFEPVIKKGDSIQVQTRDGSETYALAPIECPINDGIISHRGQDGVKLPAGGEAANPSLIRWKATFSRMQAGGKSFTLAPVIFDAVPGGEIDLTMVAPVAGAPEGVVRGPRGTSLESIIVDGSELVFTAVDDAGSFEIARIPLDDMVRAEADAAADGVRDALAVDVAASQAARDVAEGHATRAATSESNAKTSETNAKQSETNAGNYAAVSTTAATEAVDAMESARGAAASIANSVTEAAQHATRASQSESGAAAFAQNAEDAADRIGTAEQVGTWAAQAQDAADRIGTAETVEGWANSARDSASAAEQSASKSKEYRDAAFNAASSTADEVRGDLINIASGAATHATDASRSAARAKTSETNAATHEANSLSAAERAEFAAEETIQQVEGDFATRNYVDSKDWNKGELGSQSINDITAPGVYTQGMSALATQERGYPDRLRGTLYVTDLKGIVSQMYVTSYRPAVWQREKMGSTWGQWNLITSDSYKDEMGRVISGGTDWNTLLANGFYFRRSAGTNDTNSPTNVLGVLFVANGGHSSNASSQLYFAASGDGLYYRARNATGVWTAWERLDGGGSAPTVDSTGAARRDFLVSQLHDRKGGTIGTGGKAAVAFRFDHWVEQFNDIALPLLKQYNMPWSQALNARSDNGHPSGSMDWLGMQDEALSSGGEVFNHSATHRDAQDSAKLVDEIVNGRDELREKFPLLTIDGWMQPGTGGSFGGLQPYRNEDDYATEAGTLVANYHAIVYGYRGGFARLNGQPSIGQGHLSMDRRTAGAVKQHIDRAVSLRAGVVLMMHPNALDGSLDNSTMNAAAFEEVLAYVSQLRSEGKLEVLSASGLQVADSSHGKRRSLIDVDLTGSGTGYRDLGWEQVIADGPHEVHATIKAAGTVTIRVETADGVLDKTWTLNINGWREVWLPFTLPVGASRVTVTTTGATGGQLAVRPI